MLDNEDDYCGPSGKHWFLRLISFFCPDVIFGVDLRVCCHNHDKDNTKNGANKAGDLEFREEIRDRFFIAGKNATLGFCVAWFYFIMVRIGGIAYKFLEWKNK